MEGEPKEQTTKLLIKRERRSYKKKRDKARASRIHCLKKRVTGNKNELTSLNNKLKETMSQTTANNKLLKRYEMNNTELHSYNTTCL